jgi:luciferase family oxidoreductase group 1
MAEARLQRNARGGVRLGVLDQSPIRAGGTAGQAINESVLLAEATERWGYHRYWLAEHHSSQGLAGTAPEILAARIAAATSTMRVGAGGVMLSHYSALKVAESFRVLEALYPGRIDLGIGRAPGSDMRTARALQHGAPFGAEQFPQQVVDLIGWLRDGLPAGHPYAGVEAQPGGEGMPEIWLLGSSDQSAILAAYLGCAFSFAHFITDEGGIEVMAAYRRLFRAAPWRREPCGSVGVFVLVADSEAEALRLARSRDLWRLGLERGRIGPIPTIEEAEAYPYSEDELRRIAHYHRRQIIGAPEQARGRLLSLAGAYGVEELIIVSICYDFAARLRSYELLAQAFDLQRRG